MALPALVLAVATAVGGVIAMTDQMRCGDAAATAARLAARGEPISVVRSIALRAAPSGATLSLVTTGTTVTASVTAHLSAPGILGRLGTLTFTQRSVAALESGVPAVTE
jgi:Flp pilus assembly protein TadG